jgi:general secretion pathway protein B
MSYILDALKKSDRQRNLGAPPTLQVAQLTMSAPKRPSWFYYGLLAAVLLVAGIVIGLLRPWQAVQPPIAAEPDAAISPIPLSHQAASAPLAATPEKRSEAAEEFPAPKLLRAGQAVPADVVMKSSNPAPVSSAAPGATMPIPEKTKPEEPAGLGGVAQVQEAIPLNELPPQIQREIPAMTVQLHSYSSKPSERFVYINSIKLREDESLMSGLRLEQITPDGMIFSYKGYRFQRGIR